MARHDRVRRRDRCAGRRSRTRPRRCRRRPGCRSRPAAAGSSRWRPAPTVAEASLSGGRCSARRRAGPAAVEQHETPGHSHHQKEGQAEKENLPPRDEGSDRHRSIHGRRRASIASRCVIDPPQPRRDSFNLRASGEGSAGIVGTTPMSRRSIRALMAAALAAVLLAACTSSGPAVTVLPTPRSLSPPPSPTAHPGHVWWGSAATTCRRSCRASSRRSAGRSPSCGSTRCGTAASPARSPARPPPCTARFPTSRGSCTASAAASSRSPTWPTGRRTRGSGSRRSRSATPASGCSSRSCTSPRSRRGRAASRSSDPRPSTSPRSTTSTASSSRST